MANFWTNLFNRKKKDAPQQETPQKEAPVKEEPRQEATPVPMPDTKASESIRTTIDNIASKLIATDPKDPAVDAKVQLGMALQPLLRKVGDETCTFNGFDEAICGALTQLEYLCTTSTPEQLADHLSKIEAAIAARSNTEQNTPKFCPTMETHYYSVMLIELQGRLNALIESKRMKEAFIAHVKTLPVNERAGYRETVQAFTAALEDTELAMLTLYKRIGVCQGGLMDAHDALIYSGQLPAMNIEEVLSGIYKKAKQFRVEYDTMEQSANRFQVMHQAEVEEQMMTLYRATAARAQQDRIAAETETYSNIVARQIDELTGRVRAAEQETPPVAQETAPAVQQVAPAMQEVKPAAPAAQPVKPAMPDVFHDKFDVMTM